MSKPYIHALSSAKRYGGIPEDYMKIHEFMDSSKGVIGDNRHRALTHNAWFIMNVIPRVFGETFMRDSDLKIISSRDIAEMHVLEDYNGKFVPAASDFLNSIDWEGWMNNGKGDSVPASYKKIASKKRNTKRTTIRLDSD
jgi:hypothetical protein